MMSSHTDPDKIFFTQNNVDINNIYKIINDALCFSDGGELFLESHQSELFHFNDRVLKNADFNVRKGFGLRSFSNDVTSFVCSANISEEEISRAASLVKTVNSNKKSSLINLEKRKNSLYPNVNPLNGVDFNAKVQLLQEVDLYVRSQNKYVKQVKITLAGEWQVVQIIKKDNLKLSDVRPLVQLSISVILEKNGRTEQGTMGYGGRNAYDEFISESNWKKIADEAIRQAQNNLEAMHTPAGEMVVVLGPGWPGILLHEAIGHGLEGDFNRKGVSAYSNLLGKQVAAKGITVVDDGTVNNRRGSLNIDDEGVPSGYNVLIKDGVLVKYMQDTLNANLMSVCATGNGRRESYEKVPMPRMTNTYMLAGDCDSNEIISSVKRGLYAVNFSGGQVDITSGKFVFSASEAYLIENGKTVHPVRGATLIGNGPDVLKKVSMVGNDLKLDPGVGTCSKNGQSIPVGVGQPTLKIDSITVGGTEV